MSNCKAHISMKLFYLLCFFLINFYSINAQESLIKVEQFTLDSKILGKNREIDIHLPKNYFNTEFDKAYYPVVYVLDGERNFPMLTALEIYGTRSMYRAFPEMIIVGIRNIDRNRDFTPTVTSDTSSTKKANFPTSGKATEFLSFINDELKPYIDSNFRTNGYNILHGHSFGGLFALNTWVSNPNSFDAYIAIDPSLWWDNRVVFDRLKEAIENNTLPVKNVFVALAFESQEVSKDRLNHGGSIREFCEKVLTLNPEIGELSDWKYYPDKDHGTVPWPSSLDAFTSLFQGMQLEAKKIPSNPELVKKQYEQLSLKLGRKIFPDESLLLELVKYTKKNNKSEEAQILIDYYKEIYPKSKQLLNL